MFYLVVDYDVCFADLRICDCWISLCLLLVCTLLYLFKLFSVLNTCVLAFHCLCWFVMFYFAGLVVGCFVW